jgi:uncharacterized membrane protein
LRELEETIEIESPVECVWSVLRDFAGVARWAPYVKRSEARALPEFGVGAYRVMRHAWGFRLEESIVEWNEGVGYSFDVVVVPYPMIDVFESWSVTGVDRCSIVNTRVRYNMRLGWFGRLLDQVLVRHLVRREMREGLRGLKRYIESAEKLSDELESSRRVSSA